LADYNPYILGNNPAFDGIHAAASNLLGGEIGGAYRSLTNPDSLSPEERKKLSARLGLDGTILAPIVDISTHPLVIAGALLTVAFPRLPTAAALRNFVNGAKNTTRRLNPLMQWLAPARDLFKGTRIPDDVDLGMKRYINFGLDANREIIDSLKSVPELSRASLMKVIAHLDGLPSKNHEAWGILRDWSRKNNLPDHIQKKLDAPISIAPLTSEEKTVYDAIDRVRTKFYKEVFGKAENKKEILQTWMRANGDFSPITDEMVEKFAKQQQDYWPHMARLQRADREEILREMDLKFLGADELKTTVREAQVKRQASAPAKVTAKGREADRTGYLLPSAEHLEELGVDDDIVRMVRAQQSEQAAKAFDITTGEGNRRIAKSVQAGYSLDLNEVWQPWVTQTSRLYAYTIPTAEGAMPIGRRLVNSMRELRASPDRYYQKLATRFQETYVPMLLGRMTPGQMSSAHRFDQAKDWALGVLEHPTISKHAKENGTYKWLRNALDSPNTNYLGVSQSMADYLYLGALGANPSPVGLNFLQTLTTTIPWLGVDATMKGIDQVVRGVIKIQRTPLAKRSDVTREVFKDFFEAGLELDPIHRQEVARILEGTALKGVVSSTKQAQSWYGKMSEFMMSPFAKTETFNRLTAFYASRAKRIKELDGLEVYDAVTGGFAKLKRGTPEFYRYLNQAAKEDTLITQFGQGFWNKAGGIADWNPVITQFSNYPLGITNFAAKGLRHPAAMGRMMLTGGLAYSGARELLGTDVSGGLMFGSFPGVEENRPFAPLPLVSPVCRCWVVPSKLRPVTSLPSNARYPYYCRVVVPLLGRRQCRNSGQQYNLLRAVPTPTTPSKRKTAESLSTQRPAV
jgi:hypothetical protein